MVTLLTATDEDSLDVEGQLLREQATVCEVERWGEERRWCEAVEVAVQEEG